MSRTIDQQVVEMQFDNRHFEQNVKTSMSTLERLKQSLNLTGASKGLENINAAARKNNISVLGQAAETVGVKFSAMQVAGITAIANITNSAVNAGKRIVKSLTIDPVTSGFHEYELKMGSIQTIMASTGESLETVNKYLNELNEYSDQTIYSFSDMTQNIGKFTNAGVKLEDAVLAIKGISNEAALSGANANEASRAMYNFAQALSAGYVKLIDWKSIENANMATVEFKDELIKTAAEMGTLGKMADGTYKVLTQNNMGSVMDQTISSTKNFNDSLNYQWMTTEVLIKTLGKYADMNTEIGRKATQAATEVKTFSQMMDALKESAQSGWAQTWEIIFGDFYEAKDLWTDVNNTIGKIIDAMSDARNNLLKSALGSSWESVAESIQEAGLSVEDFKKELKKTLKDNGKSVDKLEEQYGDLSVAIKAGEVSADEMRTTLKRIIKEQENVSDSTGKVTISLEKLKKVSDQVMSGDFGNGAKRMKALAEAGYDYATIQNNINEILGSNVRHTSELTEAQKKQLVNLSNLSNEQRNNTKLTEGQKKALDDLKLAAEKTGGTVNDLIKDLEQPSGRMLMLDTFKNIWNEIGKIFTAISDAWTRVFGVFDAEALGDKLYNFIQDLHAFSSAFSISEEFTGKVENITAAMLNLMKLGGSIAGKSVITIIKVFDALLGLFDMSIMDIPDKIATIINSFANWVEKETLFGYDTGWDDIALVLKAVIDGILGCVNAFLKLDAIGHIIENVRELLIDFFSKDSFEGFIDYFSPEEVVANIGKFFANIETWITSLNNSENLIKDILSGIHDSISWAADVIFDAAAKIGKKIVDITTTLFGIDPQQGILIANLWDDFVEIIHIVLEGLSECVGMFIRIKPIQEIITIISEKLKNAWNILINSFRDDNGKFVGLSNFIETLNKTIESIKSWINDLNGVKPSELGGHIISGLAKGISSGIKLAVEAITNIATTIIETFKAIFDINSPSRVMITLAGFIISGLIVGLTQNKGALGTFVSNFGTSILEIFMGMFRSIINFAKELDFGKLVAIALSGGLIYTIKKLADALSLFGSPLAALTGMLKSIGGAFKGVGEALKDAIKLRSKVEAIKGIAVALLILTGALWLMSKIKWQQLVGGTVILAALAGILFVLANACEKLNKIGEFGLTSASLLAISGAILALAIAFKLISTVKPEQMITTVIGFAGVCIALIQVMKGLAKVTSGCQGLNAKGLGSVFTKFAVGLLMMVGVIKLMSMLKMGEVLEATLTISLIAVLFRLYTSAFKGMDPTGIQQAGWFALKMSTSLLLMMAVVKIASMFSIGDVAKGVAVITILGLLFRAFVGIVNTIKGVDDSNALAISKLGNMLLKFSVSLLIISAAIKILGSMSVSELFKGVVVIYAIGILMQALIEITGTKGYSAHKIGLMLIEFSVALLIISAVLVILKNLDNDGLAKALGIITVLTGLFAGLIAVTKWAEHADKLKGTLITFTVALGILAVALIALSLLDAKQVAVAGVVLTSVIGMFAVLIRSTSVISGSVKDLTKAIGTVILLTGIVVVLAFIIKELSTLEPERAIASAKSIGVLLLAMSGSIWILNHSKGLSLKELGIAISGIFLLSLIAVMLSEMMSELKGMDPKTAIPTATALGILLTAMSVSLTTVSTSKSMTVGKLGKTALLLGALSVVVIALSGVINYLKDVNPANAIGAATAMGILLLSMSASFNIIATSKSITQSNLPRIVAILATMTVAIAVLGHVIGELSKCNPVSAIASAIAIGVLLAALTLSFTVLVVNKTMSSEKFIRIAGLLAAMTIVIGALGFVIAKLSTCNPISAVGSAIALGILINALTIAILPLNKIGGSAKNAAKGALALTSMVIPLAAFAILIANMPEITESDVKGIIALTSLAVAMTVLIVPLSYIGKFAGKAALGALALTSMVIPLAAFGIAISKLPDISNKIKTIVALTQLLTAMTLLLIPLTVIGNFALGMGIGITGLTAMVIPLTAFALAIHLLPDISGKIAGIDALVEVLGKMTVILAIASIVGPLAPAGIAAISAMVGVVLIFGTLATAIGGLIELFPTFEKFLDKGVDILVKMANGLGRALGGFITGISDEIMDSLPGYGLKLSQFMVCAMPFISGISGVGDDVVKGAKNLGSAMITLLGAELLNTFVNFTSLGVSSLPSLGRELSNFIEAADPFFQGVKTIGNETITGVKNLADAVLAITGAQLLDSINNWIIGGTNFEELGTQLAEFGKAVVQFDREIHGYKFDQEAVKAAKAAAEIMLALQQALDPIGGVVGFFCGERDLGNFGAQLASFGSGIRMFSDTVSNGKGGSALNKDAIQAAKDAGDLMVALQGSIAPVDGFVQAFTGSKNVGTFGEQVKMFAEQLVLASQALCGGEGKTESALNDQAIEAASNAGKLLAEVQKAIPEDKWLDGKISIDEFGSNIYNYGQYLKSYSNVLSEVNGDKVSESTTWSKTLVDIAKQVAGIDTEKINNFSSVKKIGESIKGYSDNVKDADSGKINSSITQVEKLIKLVNSMVNLNTGGIEKFQSALKTLGETNVDGIVEAFNVSSDKMFAAGANAITKIGEGMASRQTTLFTTATTVVKEVTTGLLSNASSFIKMGEVYVTNMGSGFINRADRLAETAKTVAKLAAGDKGAKAAYDSFKTSGGYVVSGFANGISLKSYIATNAAKEMAKAAAKAAKSILKINSPSKVFMGIGSYVVEGFVKGIDNNVNSVISSTSDMADSARSGFSRAIGRMTDLLNGEMDTQPTIRPVLDLSDVKSGAATIGSMFGNPSIGVMSNLGSINNMMNSRNQNGSNADVVSAIDKLAGLLGNTSGNTYQINGITYNDDTPIAEAVSALIRATVMEGRV